MASDDSVEVTALSVEEAIIVGLTRLTALRDEVDIEILDEGNRGFLGIGSREARVRLTKRPQREAVVPAPIAQPEEAEPVVEQSPANTQDTAEMEAEAPEMVVTEPAVPVEPVVSVVPEEKRPDDVAVPPVDAVAPEPTKQPRSAQTGTSLDRATIEDVARDIVKHLLPGLAVEVSVEWVDEDRPTLWISLTGRDADSLVGPRARNLHSLQYLFRSLIYQQADGDYNVVVDADGYRRRRRRSLESLAQKKADQAVEQGQPVRLRAMPAHERRIIHMLLKEDDRVSTESSGKGRDRAVTIVPGKSGKSNRS